MKYERFSQLWDKYVGERQKNSEITPTLQALIEYGQGDTSKIDAVREFLDR